jgi:peroxiredoxin
MKAALSRHIMAAAALLLFIAAPAVAADAPSAEQKAMAELKEMLDVSPRPKTRAEAMKQVKTLLPKVEKFAEEHAKDKAGAQALMAVAQMWMLLDDWKKVEGNLAVFAERFPEHESMAAVKYFAALAKYRQRDYEGAKKALAAHLKAYPEFRGKQQVEKLLDDVKTIGSPATPFTSKDLRGEAVKLSDFKGKVLLLDFYAAWCKPCVAELPNLIKLYDKYHPKGFQILGVSLDRNAEAAKDFVKKHGIKWPVVFEKPGGWKNPVAQLYNIRSIPSTYLLDEKGNVLAIGIRGEELADTLEKLFEKKADKPAE